MNYLMSRNDPLAPADEASYLCHICERRFDVLGEWEMDEIERRPFFDPFNKKETECCGVECDLR